jgi:PST family polysaccharide transporter
MTAEDQVLGRRVGTSALWTALNTGVLRVATFATSLVIARLVTPYDFGVFTVALTIFNILFSISELGVSSALVREYDRSRAIAPTIFTISLVNGAVLSGVMVAFAPELARALGAPAATTALRILALVVLLSGFSAVPAALMSRDFMQRQRFITDAAFFVASTASMLVLVLLGHPVIGLAVSRVAGQVVTVILIMAMSPEKYWPGFRWHEAKPLLAFGLPLAGSYLISLAIANVDFIVIGHQLGARRLGYYNLAFNISGWPVTIFSSVLISVTLPTLSRVRDRPVELNRHLAAGLSAIAATSFPVCALLAALSVPLIDVVYGARWHAAWSALVVLALFGAARTVLMLFSDLAIATGLTRRLFVIQALWLLTLIPVMVFCVTTWGIAGAGIAHALVVVLLVVPMYLLVLRRSTSIDLGRLLPCLVRPIGASLAAAGVAYAATRLVDAQTWQLMIGFGAGFLTYLLLSGTWLLEVKRTLVSMYWGKPDMVSSQRCGRHRRSASVNERATFAGPGR